MKLPSTILIALFAIPGIFATPATAAEFRFDTQGGEPFYQSRLIKEVYQFTHEDALQDLTINNAAGEQVPYALLPNEKLHPQTATRKETRPLSIFAIGENHLNSPDTLRIQLEKNAENTTINVTSGEAASNNRTVFLLDAGTHHQPLQSLSVDWSGQRDKLVYLQILVSDDLKNWSNAGDAALLKTAQNGSTLEQNVIMLDAPTEARYLQIRPTASVLPGTFNLAGVTAEYSSMQAIAPQLLWQELHLMSREEADKAGLVNLDFEAQGHYPAGYARVRLPQQNTITAATVLVRNATNEPWRQISRASVFHLAQNGKILTSPDITIAPTVARYWRLQFNQAEGGIGTQSPILSLGWLPPTVIWNARGQAPYTLHVGEAPDIVNRVAIASLIPEFNINKVQQLPVAILLPSTNGNAAEAMPQNTWVKPVDYKRWLLWGGLLLGVLLLAGMAYSLLKSDSRE